MFGMVLGAALVFSAHHFHLVRTGEQFLLIPKIEVSLVDPYVDVRDWHLDDWEEHPELLEAMKKQGHEDLLPDTRSGDAGATEAARRTLEDAAADHLAPVGEKLIRRSLSPRSGAADSGTRRE